MSIDATRWAYAQKTGSSARKAVLLSMADRAGEDHTCYPSLDRIAADTELNRKTVIKAIGELEEMGFIRFTGKTRGHGAKVYQLVGVPSREYTANFGDDGRPKNGTPSSTKFGTATTSTKNGTSTNFGTATSTNFGTQTIIEPSMNHHNNNFMSQDEKNDQPKNPKTRKNSTVTAKPKNQGKDFEFTANQKSKCQAHGLDIHGQFEQFKNYHEAKGSKWKDWSRAFDYWLNNAVKWSKSSQPTNQTHNQTQGQHHAPHSQPQSIKPNSDAEYALIRDQRNAELRAMGYPIS